MTDIDAKITALEEKIAKIEDQLDNPNTSTEDKRFLQERLSQLSQQLTLLYQIKRDQGAAAHQPPAPQTTVPQTSGRGGQPQYSGGPQPPGRFSLREIQERKWFPEM